MEDGDCVRDGKWTQSVAVGTKGYCRQLTTEQLIAEIDTPAG